MTWLKHLSPFRIAVVLYLGFSFFQLLPVSSDLPNEGWRALFWAAVMSQFLWGAMLWLMDMIMRKFIKEHLALVGIQLLVLLAMYYLLVV